MSQFSSSISVDHLVTEGHVWRANRPEHQLKKSVTPTGFTELDQLLGHGWPKGELVELLYAAEGSGELYLLLPLLRQISPLHAVDDRGGLNSKGDTTDSLVMWVDPPHIPNGPSLQRAGIDTTRMRVVHSERLVDRLWVLEQALRSGSCALVMGWLPRGYEKAIRRLQVAAHEGQCHSFLFRPVQAKEQHSPAPNRLVLSTKKVPSQKGVWLDVIKRRGSWPSRGHHIAFNYTHLGCVAMSE